MKNILFLLFLLAAGLFNVQFPARTPTINDTLNSVWVSSDNRITFSIYAPKASEVTVGDDFTLGAPAARLTKSDNGVGHIHQIQSLPIPILITLVSMA